MDPIKNIVVDGVEHPVENFSEKVRGLIVLRQAWAAELQQERTAVSKSEAAMRSLDIELKQLINSELNL